MLANEKDAFFMKQAIAEAQKGAGCVSPNPLVGCVIVKNDEILSRGFHQKFGEAHAEINAIDQLSDEQCDGADIYITLEPCFHYGKTPPCVETLIAKKFKRVVIGAVDVNSKVSGKSIVKLKEAGYEVIQDVCKKECDYLTRFFRINQKFKRPYVILKSAESADGYITANINQETKITQEDCNQEMHVFRSEVDAILVGANTVRIDNPLLTNRYTNQENSKRIIFSFSGDVDENAHVFVDSYKQLTMLCVPKKIYQDMQMKFPNITVLSLKTNIANDKFDMDDFFQKIQTYGVYSILVEGGNQMWLSFMKSGYVDEIRKITSSRQILGGVENLLKVTNDFEVYTQKTYDQDILKVYINKKSL